MNRRDFCLTAGTLLAGAALSGTVTVCSEERAARFRAQKVFLESWRGESFPATPFVRQQLENIRRNECNGVILLPGRSTTTLWTDLIKIESLRTGLAVFTPFRLTRSFLQRVRATVPLAQADLHIQSLEGRTAKSEGLLLMERGMNVIGLVLYDSSYRCWTGFAASGAGLIHNVEHNEDVSRLAAARWLDLVRREERIYTAPCQ